MIGSSRSYQVSSIADQTFELEAARQALISYAVNYIDHYGVQGAGVGHLPCPDTDPPDTSHGNLWVRDGPNPPCAGSRLELGWLPRHVNTNTGRYHFHTRSRQRLWYAVSGRFINNPVNRIVNGQTTGDIELNGFDDVIAAISVPPLKDVNGISKAWWESHNQSMQRNAYAVIRANDILVPAMQRVGSWLLDRLDSSKLPSECQLGAEDSVLHWLNEALAIEISIDEKPSCAQYVRYLRSSFALLEEAPYERHWFVRNEWNDFIKFEYEVLCLAPRTVSCQFVLQPISGNYHYLVFKLQANDANSQS